MPHAAHHARTTVSARARRTCRSRRHLGAMAASACRLCGARVMCGVRHVDRGLSRSNALRRGREGSSVSKTAIKTIFGARLCETKRARTSTRHLGKYARNRYDSIRNRSESISFKPRTKVYESISRISKIFRKPGNAGLHGFDSSPVSPSPVPVTPTSGYPNDGDIGSVGRIRLNRHL